MSTRRRLHAGSRLGIALLLQIAVIYWLYDWLHRWQFGGLFVGHANFPSGPFLLQASVSGVALVLVAPVLLNGTDSQKVLGGFLVPMPLLLLGVDVY